MAIDWDDKQCVDGIERDVATIVSRFHVTAAEALSIVIASYQVCWLSEIQDAIEGLLLEDEVGKISSTLGRIASAIQSK